jgi:hypothetical protein
MMGTGLNVSHRQRLIGLGLILATGLVHLVEAPEYYAEVKYIGALFVASMVGSAVAAYGMWRNERRGWLLGLAVAGGSFAGYVLSRTVGLPSFREASWAQALEPMGILSLVVEGLFVGLALSLLKNGLALVKPSLVLR